MGASDTPEKPYADILDFRSEVCCDAQRRSSPEQQQMATEI